jgi:hypothetical protein
MTHGALHRVLTHEPISFRTYYALNVVGQKVFEIHTKHRYFSLPAAFVSCSSSQPARYSEGVVFLCLTHCHDFHPSENLCQFNTPPVDSRFDGAFGNLQQIHDLGVTKLFDISQYHART